MFSLSWYYGTQSQPAFPNLKKLLRYWFVELVGATILADDNNNICQLKIKWWARLNWA